jgi:O-acetylhomoserine/O-acetylserine sulfhydrylase-like pyridoxal-dependent enzyme
MPSFHTLAVHADERLLRPNPSTPLRASFTPVATPIYHSAAYVYEDLDDLDAIFAGTRQGPVYARYGNPTLTASVGGENPDDIIADLDQALWKARE